MFFVHTKDCAYLHMYALECKIQSLTLMLISPPPLPEYRALYNFTALQPGDLSLTEGETVVVIASEASGWWRGCVGSQEGWFPGSYVEVSRLGIN